MANTERIPADVTDVPPALRAGKITYDMVVSVSPGQTIQEAILSRIPPEVLEQVVEFDGTARLVIEINQI